MSAPLATFDTEASRKCWRGRLTFQRCCVREDPACWSEEPSARERCCGNQSVPWWHGGRVGGKARFVLWFVRDRPSCVTSPHLLRAPCCGGGAAAACWDGAFTEEKCCGHVGLPVRGDPLCWNGIYSYERCCETPSGPADSSCWGPPGEQAEFTPERCCGGAAPAAAAAGGRNWTALGALAARCAYARPGRLAWCAGRWPAALGRGTAALAEAHARGAALSLARAWRARGLLAGAAAEAPAFVVGVLLLACCALLDAAAGPAEGRRGASLFEELRLFLSVYRAELPSISASDVSIWSIGVLDATIRDIVLPWYGWALHSCLFGRIENQPMVGVPFRAVNGAYKSALAELISVIDGLGFPYVPIQGTLISLLRYGDFPAGILNSGKEDVVDNDAELMVLLDPKLDYFEVSTLISLGLEALDWPPCQNSHFRKMVCFSLRHKFPCKLELYFYAVDTSQGIIQQTRRCFPDGRCEFDPRASPLQRWAGQLPVDVVFPLRQCRFGSPGARVSCPSRPVEMLQGWNNNAYVQAKSDSCLALPVLSKARAYSDSRNERLMQEGLSPGDVRLLHGYARSLHAQGLASFHEHLRDEACVQRQRHIEAGGTHAGLSQL